jgi:hypothetical protein
MAVCLAFSRAPLTGPNRCDSPKADPGVHRLSNPTELPEPPLSQAEPRRGGNVASSGTGRVRKPTLLRFNQTTPPANPPHSSVQAFVGMRRMLRPYPDRLAGRAQLEAFSGESSQGRPTRSNSCRSRGRRRCVSRSSAMSSSTPAASADPVASLRIFANRRAATR